MSVENGHNLTLDSELIVLDDRLSKSQEVATIEMSARTAARSVKAAFIAQTQLNKVRLVDMPGENGEILPRERIQGTDSAGIQLLKAYALDIDKLLAVPLGDSETELNRIDRIMTARAHQVKIWMEMQAAIARTLDRSTRASQEAAKLQFKMRKHQDDQRKRGDFDGKTIDEIADGR